MINQKVGIYGGTFDPVHTGHIITTRYVLEKRELDKIIFVPNNISPLKTDSAPTSNEHRLAMLKLAISDLPQFEFSDYELIKGDVSFTYDTLLEMKKHYSEIELIIGYDNLVVFDEWRNPDEIFDIAKVIVMKRNSDNPGKKNKYFDRAVILETPAIDISATEIRNRVRDGLPIDFLVPDKVKEYIYQHGLYK